MTELTEKKTPLNFIRRIIEEDINKGKNQGKVATRFPPEPNGYLHIGHAKAICINFGIAKDYNGTCNLRFDDTNPEKEDTEYIDSIKEDIKWLGFDWEDREYFASDYFEKLHDFAVRLIKAGKAYVCHLTPEETREHRGTLTEPGINSPYRDRSVEENLELFDKMKNGELNEGECVLKAKIDMASPNMNLRDPTIYRIRKAHHHRTGDKWCIYPMYDFTHGQSDSIEGITHSLCSLEFEDHRPLYDWYIENIELPHHPQQIEFARLNLNYTVMSKRKLLELVTEEHVDGWDDPRMPTLCGLRRRGFTPASIRDFIDRVGVAKRDSCVDYGLLEDCIRQDLNESAPRAMCVLNPLKVIITNYPENKTEELEAQNHPQKPELGTRKVPFTRELYIEKEDFMEVPAKKFHRLTPGKEVRLRYAFFVKCEKVIKDDNTGEVTEVHCTYDPATIGGDAPDGRKVKGTIHWVSATKAKKATVRLYDRLFITENPSAEKDDFKKHINPDSFTTLENCWIEPLLSESEPESRFQFERLGYFCTDRRDHKKDSPVFNRVVTLRDSWSKIQKKG